MDAMMKTIFDYFVAEFLEGSDSDFDMSTPLLELGIIDSSSILRFSGFLEKKFSVDIQPEDLVLDNFQDLNAVVNMVKTKT